MHIRHPLYFTGKFHDRRVIPRRSFHKATGAEFGEHFPLNPAFFGFYRLACVLP